MKLLTPAIMAQWILEEMGLAKQYGFELKDALKIATNYFQNKKYPDEWPDYVVERMKKEGYATGFVNGPNLTGEN